MIDSLNIAYSLDSLKTTVDSIKCKNELVEKNLETVTQNFQTFKDDMWKHDILFAFISVCLATILGYWFSRSIEKWKSREKRKQSIYKTQEFFQQTILQLVEIINGNKSMKDKIPDLLACSNHFSFLNKFLYDNTKTSRNFYNSIYTIFKKMNTILGGSQVNVNQIEQLKLCKIFYLKTDKILDTFDEFMFSKPYLKQTAKKIIKVFHGDAYNYQYLRTYAIYSSASTIFFEIFQAFNMDNPQQSINEIEQICEKYKL